MTALPKPRRKSAKHRALSAERKIAEEAGTLPQWYAAREAEKAPPVPPQAPPDFSIRTLEATAWSEEDRYPRWLLPTNTGSNRPTPPRNF